MNCTGPSVFIDVQRGPAKKRYEIEPDNELHVQVGEMHVAVRAPRCGQCPACRSSA